MLSVFIGILYESLDFIGTFYKFSKFNYYVRFSDFLCYWSKRWKVKNPLLNIFSIRIGDNNEIGFVKFSNDLYGSNLKISEALRSFVT